MVTDKPIVVCPADLTCARGARQVLETHFAVRYIAPAAEALAEAIADADGYFASLHVRLDGELIARAVRLKAIATASTGLDHIDLKVAADKRIAVLSLKDDREFLDRITATAELTWALALSACRRLPAAAEAARQGHWARDKFRGHQIAYRTFGVLGLGRLGTIVSQYARAFRMNVIVLWSLGSPFR